MSIQDINYLKQNCRENSMKFYFPFNYKKSDSSNNFLDLNIFRDNVSLNTFSKRLEDKNDYIINNVFTIHILNVFIKDEENFPYGNCILTVYANDHKMDSISINQQINNNIIGKEYEKIILNPLAKVTELTFKFYDFENNEIINDIDGNISILIRNFEPKTDFNDNYNELNPQYDPHIAFNYTSSDEDD